MSADQPRPAHSRSVAVGIALAGASAVLLGAFGAHALSGILDARGEDLWHTAVGYQFWHALAFTLGAFVAPHGRGLGSLFDSGRIASNYPLMFAVLIALAVLGIVLYYIVVALERIFAGWAERRPT